MAAVAPGIRADFLVEVGEILDQLGSQLAQLERNPSDRECLNTVFRGFHTIKGGAGFLELGPMVTLCSAIEDRLDAARSHTVPLDAAAFDAAQQGLDLLLAMLSRVAADQPTDPAPPTLLAALRDGTAGRVSAGPSHDPQASAPLEPGAPLPPDPEMAAYAAMTAAAVANGDDIADLDFEALLDTLHGKGGIPGEHGPPQPGDGRSAVPGVPVEARLDHASGLADAPAPSAASPRIPRAADALADWGAPAFPAARAPSASAQSVRALDAVAAMAAMPAPAADATVRVDVRRLDAMVNLVGELVLARNRLKTLRSRLRNDELDRAVASLDVATSRLQSAVMSARMQPVGRVFARFPKLARDVARQLHKQVELEVVGADTELDRNLVEGLADPLVHLVRNAIDHGIELPIVRQRAGKPEQGRVRLTAQQEGDHVAIEVRDDGAGIDPEMIRRKACEKGLVETDVAARMSHEECLQLLFLPGFSTREAVSELSGRGVGMDVVQSRIRELSGFVQIHSELGVGSRFVIRVPLTLAILPTLLVEIGQDVYALPLARVVEVMAHAPANALWMDGQPVLDLRQAPLPLIDLREWLGVDGEPLPSSTVVVLEAGDRRYCLVVDRVHGREEAVIKALPRTLRGLPGYAGASLVGDGRMALILDVDAVLRTGLRGRSPKRSSIPVPDR